jgi:hypothetical protein
LGGGDCQERSGKRNCRTKRENLSHNYRFPFHGYCQQGSSTNSSMAKNIDAAAMAGQCPIFHIILPTC